MCSSETSTFTVLYCFYIFSSNDLIEYVISVYHIFSNLFFILNENFSCIFPVFFFSCIFTAMSYIEENGKFRKLHNL